MLTVSCNKTNCRNSYWRCSLKKSVLKNFANFIEKQLEIPSKHYLSIKFLNKMTVISISEKFKTRTFPCSVNMAFHAKENIILFFWELKNHLSRFLKYHAIFVNTKERSSFYHFSVLKKISFLTWTPFKRSPF